MRVDTVSNVQRFLPVHSDDPMESYLREVSAIPLLSPEEERELTFTLRQVRHEISELLLNSPDVADRLLRHREQAKKQGKQILLDPQERKEYLLLYRSAHHTNSELLRRLSQREQKERELTSRLVEANVRLVISIARRYRNVGMELVDLIQEGNASLLRAIELFDPTLGFRFSTYATYWIKQGITRAIADKATMIRIPAKMLGVVRKIHRTALRLEQNLGRAPTEEELIRETGLPTERVRQARTDDFEIISLHSVLWEKDGLRWEETICSDDPDPSLEFAGSALKEKLREALLSLSPREIAVLRTRFGLDDGEFKSLAETGLLHDISREKARLIEKGALHKLRHRRTSELFRSGAVALESRG